MSKGKAQRFLIDVPSKWDICYSWGSYSDTSLSKIYSLEFSISGFLLSMGFDTYVTVCTHHHNSIPPLHLSLLPNPQSHWSFFSTLLHFFSECWYLESYNMKSFQTNYFHLVYALNFPPMSFRSLTVHFFLTLNNFPSLEYTTVYWPTPLLKDILVAFMLWQFMNKTDVVNICVQACVWTQVFNSFR